MFKRRSIDEAKKGSAEILILALIEERGLHGYEIARQIDDRSGGTLRFTLASLYATLYRLEDRGWIRGRWVEKAGQRRRCHYRITEAGRRSWPRSARTGPASSRRSARSPACLTPDRPMAHPHWPDLVRRHAEATGAERVPLHVVDELSAHLEDLYRAARTAGSSEAEAVERALAALRESPIDALLGPRRRARHPADSLTGLPHVSPLRSLSMRHALRLAVRQFTRHPGFALVTVLVLGSATGASVAVYTVVDAVLLRPLPYTSPQQLLTLWDTNQGRGLTHEPMSPVTLMDYRRLDAFKDVAGWWRPDINLTDPGMDPVRVRAIETSANLFSLLGVSTQAGPGFPADGPFFDRTRIAVISDRLWRARYQADPGIIGKQLSLSSVPYTIVGVMPPRFHFPDDVDVWQRLQWDFHQHSRQAHFVESVARLKPGVDVTQARAQAATLGERLGKEFAASNGAWRVRLVPLVEEQLGYYRPALIVLFGAVGLLMVIGCLNVASLLLTRALSREREVAVRTALGASPRHLVAQLLAEATVLSVAGAIVGVIATAIAIPAIVAASPVDVPRLEEADDQPPRPGLRRRHRDRDDAALRAGAGARVDSTGADERSESLRARGLAREPHAVSGARRGRSGARLRAPHQLRAPRADGRPHDERADGRDRAASGHLTRSSFPARPTRTGMPSRMFTAPSSTPCGSGRACAPPAPRTSCHSRSPGECRSRSKARRRRPPASRSRLRGRP